jgi:hypothetical protein
MAASITSITSNLHPALDANGAAYLDLLKRAITRELFAKPWERHTWRPRFPVKRELAWLAQRMAMAFGLEVVKRTRIKPDAYIESGDAAKNRAEDAESMLGTKQFDNMRVCIEDVVRNGVRGDLLEAGVWRGGMTIFMRGALKALGATNRKLWVCDSFSGLPKTHEQDRSAPWFEQGDMAASLQEVKDNFERYGLLDERVEFVKGFFKDTLPGPVGELAILRMDADLYESTRDVLLALYPKLSPGGYLICDDYSNIEGCRRAVDEYRAQQGIADPIEKIDQRAIYWRKS